jgi:putative intracellular protease/amidase
MNKLNTGIFIFEGVEALDFAGPFEVFSRTRLVPGVESRRSDVPAPYNVFTVAKSGRSGACDGWVARTAALSQNAANKARLTTSVGTGALLLAKAGLLSGRRATTHWRARSPSKAERCRVVDRARWESETGQQNQAIPSHLTPYSIQELAPARCSSM